eukprot:1275518-Pleurochrysis_carterae.AAC.2
MRAPNKSQGRRSRSVERGLVPQLQLAHSMATLYCWPASSNAGAQSPPGRHRVELIVELDPGSFLTWCYMSARRNEAARVGRLALCLLEVVLTLSAAASRQLTTRHAYGLPSNPLYLLAACLHPAEHTC